MTASKNASSGMSRYALTSKDIPAVIVSCAAFLGNIGVGGCVGSLGPAIPVLADISGSTEAGLGVLFTMRGIGSFADTAITTAVLHIERIKIPKEFILLASCMSLAIGMVLFTQTTDPRVLMLGTLLQGAGAGSMDLGTNCIVSDVWGDRIQPWMQALHACFGIGALVGPALVGLLGYSPAFQIMAILFLGSAALTLFKQCVALKLEDNGVNENDITSGVEMFQQVAQSPASLIDDIEGVGAAISTDNTQDASLIISANVDNSPAEKEYVQSFPVFVQIMFVLFFFVYVGIETGFGGWIPTFSLQEEVTNDQSKAAYLTAIFYGSLAVGRIVSVPVSICLSSTAMTRIQLLVSLVGSIMIFCFAETSYSLACISCSVFGAGLSGLFPLMLVLPIDYGLSMDDATTSKFVIAGSLGEAAVPILIGHSMAIFGQAALLFDTLFIGIALVLLYIVSHTYITALRDAENCRSDKIMGDYATLPLNEDDDIVRVGHNNNT